MPNQTHQLRPGSVPPPAKSSIVDDLFELTAAGSLDEMLGRALRMSIKIVGAEAGSLLFLADSLRNFQAGAFRREALARIQRWEITIGQRLQDSTWHISKATRLVSVAKLNHSGLILVSVPLLRKSRVVGLLNLVLPPGSSLTDSQRGLLTKIAGGFGQLAWLVSELELATQRLNRIGVFYEVGQALVTTFDIDKLLADTMALATNLIDAGAASIMLVDRERRELVFRVSHGARAEMMRQQRIPLDEGIAGWVASTGRPVIANDARSDTRFSQRVDVRTGFLTQSIAAVPLKYKGRVIGVLEVLNKYSGLGFTQDDILLMNFVATQAAIAIENSRLYDQLRHERDQVIKAQEQTHRDITRNLHDSTLQYLSAINMSLGHLRVLSSNANPEVMRHQITALQDLVDQATRNTRSLLFQLRPPILETHGLSAAIEYYVDQLRNVSAFDIHLKLSENIKFSPNLQRAIFAIVQEALNNVTRHANASNAWLNVTTENDRFVVMVRDDGTGFNPAALGETSSRHKTLGITYMKKQAAAINANLTIKSSTVMPERGTLVQLTLPAAASRS